VHALRRSLPRNGLTEQTNKIRKLSMKLLILQPTRTACVAVISTFLVITSAHAQPAPMTMPMTTSTQPDAHKAMMGSDGMKKSMMAGMEGMHKMTMTGDTDKDFAMMMRMHHQQGVEMAQMQITHGKSPAMKKMAKQIIAAQNKEIAQFDRWLAIQK
jgi:uncharacterized protein (DUF305 family)